MWQPYRNIWRIGYMNNWRRTASVRFGCLMEHWLGRERAYRWGLLTGWR